MADLDKDSLDNLQALCRIKCSPEEMEEIKQSIQRILQYIELLNEVDTEGVSPCNHVLQTMLKNVVRKDEIGELLPRDVFLANAPDQVGGMIRVPPVLKEIE